MAQWITWTGNILSMTVATLDSTTVTIGGALGMMLVAMAVVSLLVLVARSVLGR